MRSAVRAASRYGRERAEKRKVAEVRSEKDAQVAGLGEKLGVLQGERGIAGSCSHRIAAPVVRYQ